MSRYALPVFYTSTMPEYEKRGSGKTLVEAFEGVKFWGDALVTLTTEEESKLNIPHGTQFVFVAGSCLGFNSPSWVSVKTTETDSGVNRIQIQRDPLREGIVESIRPVPQKFNWQRQDDLAKNFPKYLEDLAQQLG